MAPHQWSEGTSRHDWLHSRGATYQESLRTKTKVSFLEKLYHDWFQTYHWSLSNKEEPIPGAVYPEPTDGAGMLKKNINIVAKKDVCTIRRITAPN